MHSKLTENLTRVRERMAIAAESAGRSPSEVCLIAVTKYVNTQLTEALSTAGCVDLAESRPQQLWEKATSPILQNARWHLIGHLQRNKVERTLPLISLVHSVDSERLLKEIDRSAEKLGNVCEILFEVNCSGEAAKTGMNPDIARSLIERLETWQSVCVKGLMTMAPLQGGDRAARDSFRKLRSLRDTLQLECPNNVKLLELSMGMSGDFTIAIEEGSTMVRVGSALFEGVSS